MSSRAATASRRPAVGPQEIPRFHAEGVAFLILTFAVGVAAMNTGNNLLYLILAMMLAFFLVSGILALSTLRSVSGSRRLPARIHAGDSVLGEVLLGNGKRWMPSFALECKDLTEDGRVAMVRFVPHLAAGEELRVHAEYRFERRGLTILPGLKIATRFPFGFLERARRGRTPVTALVYPLLDRSEIHAVLRGFGEGSEPSHRKGPGDEIHSIRPFQHGDSQRHISWKHSGRTGSLLVRDFEVPAMRRATVVLDVAAAATPERIATRFDAEIEAAVSRAAGLAAELIERGFAVRLVSHALMLPHATGMSQLERVLEALARLDPYGPLLAPVSVPEAIVGEPPAIEVLPLPKVQPVSP